MRSAVASVIGACLLGAMPSTAADPSRPIVGAVRWDAWTARSEWEKNLAPKQWHDRIPFYGRVLGENAVEVRGDQQEVMDQEIAYASAASLDYWAYCFHLPSDLSTKIEEYGIRLHLASARRSEVNFCFILMAQGYYGAKEQWPAAADRFVRYFQDPAYQKVLGGRPLLYVFYVETMIDYFGSPEAARAALDVLRTRSIEAGLGSPYVVAQVWSAESGASYVDTLGFDAISAYAWIDFSHGDQQYPYSALADANHSYWESCRATGKKVVPIVSVGWDNRPRWRDPARYKEIYQSPPRGPWYTQPSPQELADNLRAAIEWSREHPDCAEANVVIIYAWNETDEGGWLVPTLSQGTARLDAISRTLRGQEP